MADIKISQMTAASTVDDTDVLAMVGGGVTKKVTAETIKDYSVADTNNMIAPAWSATATYTKNSIVRDDGQLYKAKQDVPTGTATSNTTYWGTEIFAEDVASLLQNSMTYVANESDFANFYNKLEFYQSINITIPSSLATTLFGVSTACVGYLAKAGGNNRLQLFVVSSGSSAILCKGVYDTQNNEWMYKFKLSMESYTPSP